MNPGEYRTEIRIDAAPADVFPYLTDPDLIVRWMGDWADLDPVPDGRFTVDINGILSAVDTSRSNPTPSRVHLHCCVVRSGCAAGRRWHRAGQIIEASSSNAAAQRRCGCIESMPSS